MNAKVAEHILREENQLPAQFEFCSWACLPPGAKTYYYEMVGGFPGLYKNGKKKWPPARELTTFRLGCEEYERKAAEWSKATGKCLGCAGDGKRWTSWSASTGWASTECRACLGTGFARRAAASEPTP